MHSKNNQTLYKLEDSMVQPGGGWAELCSHCNNIIRPCAPMGHPDSFAELSCKMGLFAVTRLRQFGKDAMMKHKLFVDYVEYCGRFRPDEETWISQDLITQIEEAFERQGSHSPQMPWEMTETEKAMFLWLSENYDVYVMSTPRGVLAFDENDTRLGIYCKGTEVRVVHRLWKIVAPGALVVDLHDPTSFKQIEAFIGQKKMWPKRNCARKLPSQNTS